MEQFQRGRIVWAIIPDKNNFAKPDPRPAIVLETINAGPNDTLPVVCCSTTYAEPIAFDQIQIHKDYVQDPVTKLRKPCVVVCSWEYNLKVSEILERGGYVSGKRLRPIAAKIEELKSRK